MALEMNSHRGTGDTVEVDVKLWLTKDKDELVPDGDERAAFLYCTPGKRIPRAEAEHFAIGDSPSSATAEPDSEANDGQDPEEADVPEKSDEAAEQETEQADETDEAGEAKAQKAPANKSRSRRSQK